MLPFGLSVLTLRSTKGDALASHTVICIFSARTSPDLENAPSNVEWVMRNSMGGGEREFGMDTAYL